jgi:hypothetical protein
MARDQDNDDSIGGLTKAFVRPYVTIALAFVLSYVIVGLILAWAVASVYPEAFAIVVAILVIIGLAALLGLLYLRRRVVHILVARRADKQNTAFIKGDDKRGVHGKFRPEDLGE